LAADVVQARLREGVPLRPLRLLPVGKEAPFTVDDKVFLEFALRSNVPVVYYQPCPKTKLSHVRYLNYMLAETLREALDCRHSYVADTASQRVFSSHSAV
jgi:hypothetical protein